MSTVTTYLNLVKPASPEQFSLATYNNNNDLVDAAYNNLKKTRYVEMTGPSSNYPLSNAAWGAGVLTIDTGKQFNNTFATPNASDQIKLLETGLYLFTWQISASSPPPDAEMIITNFTSGANIATDGLKRVTTWGPMVSGIAYVTANDLVNFYTINRQGAFTGTSRIKVAKLQG